MILTSFSGLSLLPHFKSVHEYAELEVQGEFVNTLKRYKQHTALASRQFPPTPTRFFPGLTSSVSPAMQSLPLLYSTSPTSPEPWQTLIPIFHQSSQNPQHSASAGSLVLSQLQPMQIESPSPDSTVAKQAISPLCDS